MPFCAAICQVCGSRRLSPSDPDLVRMWSEKRSVSAWPVKDKLPNMALRSLRTYEKRQGRTSDEIISLRKVHSGSGFMRRLQRSSQLVTVIHIHRLWRLPRGFADVFLISVPLARLSLSCLHSPHFPTCHHSLITTASLCNQYIGGYVLQGDERAFFTFIHQ